MKIFVVLALIGASTAFNFGNPSKNGYNQLQLSRCDNKGIIKQGLVKIEPMPVVLPGKLKIWLNGVTTRALQAPLTAKIVPEKFLLGKWYAVTTCVLGQYGACDYNLCDILAKYKAQGCPAHIFGKIGITDCSCPVPIGKAAINGDEVEIPANVIPSAVNVFLNGDYRATITMKEGNEQIACFQGAASLRQPNKGGWLLG